MMKRFCTSGKGAVAKMPAKSQQMTGFQIFSAHQNRQQGYEGGANIGIKLTLKEIK